jgi:hypothetical protein
LINPRWILDLNGLFERVFSTDVNNSLTASAGCASLASQWLAMALFDRLPDV